MNMELQRQETGAGALAGIETSRAIQEVQAQVVVAKKFPRDIQAAEAQIVEACSDREFAEDGIYVFPRGDQKVSGLTIRVAEEIALAWGNINFGFDVLERDTAAGVSQIRAYAWDIQTNARRAVTFDVPHVRDTKKGSYRITDSRDIYEMEANQAQRRVRACILALLPARIRRSAENAIDQALKNPPKSASPLQKRAEQMVAHFQDKHHVSKEALENYLKKELSGITEADLVTLRGVANALKSGEAKPEDYFYMTAPPDTRKTEADQKKEQAGSSLKEEMERELEDDIPENPPAAPGASEAGSGPDKEAEEAGGEQPGGGQSQTSSRGRRGRLSNAEKARRAQEAQEEEAAKNRPAAGQQEPGQSPPETGSPAPQAGGGASGPSEAEMPADEILELQQEYEKRLNVSGFDITDFIRWCDQELGTQDDSLWSGHDYKRAVAHMRSQQIGVEV